MMIASIAPATPLGPPPGHALKWELPPHIRFKVISPRNVQLIAGLTPRGCLACHAEVQARHLIPYRGAKLCPSCFAIEAERDRAEANAVLARPPLAVRALAYVRQTGATHEIVPDADLAWQNAPEVCP